MEFKGFRRGDGGIGTRNWVGVLSTVVCANEVSDQIARSVKGANAFMHQQGCCQTPMDIETVTHTLIGIGRNPNVHSVLLVSLGCESVVSEEVARKIGDSGKEVQLIQIQKLGGATRAVEEGIRIVSKLVDEASQLKRELYPASELVLGQKCGSSDTTSGLSANPALGMASDRIIEAGGTSILGEVTEFIGAEHLLARHAESPELARKILDLVAQMESRAKSTGCDIRGGQPTMGNIKGGLTTIEEKSLGAIAKAGSAKVRGVYGYGERPDRKGLVIMDSPGREPELLTGLAAAGSNLIGFTTGLGAPQGFPFVPVVKITGNRGTWEGLQEHMDVYVGGVMEGLESLPQAAETILHEFLEVASGKMTKAEICGYTKSMDIYCKGPVI